MKAVNHSAELQSKALTGSTIAWNPLQQLIEQSWSKIPPFWPLTQLVAVNPMMGFEDLPFDDALQQAQAYFQQADLPQPMQNVNRETIKWSQTYFDEGVATIKMPYRERGFLNAILTLLPFDKDLNLNNSKSRLFLQKNPLAIIAECLFYLGIPTQNYQQFLTLMLTTLPGWATHIQYRASWDDSDQYCTQGSILKEDYLALRLMLTCLLYPEAKVLLIWHDVTHANTDIESTKQRLFQAEQAYTKQLLSQISQQQRNNKQQLPVAQFIFCIDVRSERFRRLLEVQGNYETFACAGFFNLPIVVENSLSDEVHPSCPVLIKPSEKVIAGSGLTITTRLYSSLSRIVNRAYQSLKYGLVTPFALAELTGFVKGLFMALRSFSPKITGLVITGLTTATSGKPSVHFSLDSIPLSQQLTYAAEALKLLGLTSNFASTIVLCGHGSSVQNNPYDSLLNCGACGGRHSGVNAEVLAAILNQVVIRHGLIEHDIKIPQTTHFIAAEHNTLTDQVEVNDRGLPKSHQHILSQLRRDLQQVSLLSCAQRASQFDTKIAENGERDIKIRAYDWAEVRPEWGLARNAAFVIGPRWLTKNIDLQGRCFLHSYDWQQDTSNDVLTTILLAPMIVAQWINAQYLFSTLDNVAFGSGSKVTQNITGKVGIMQGNASDLMHGLPLQSVFKTDTDPFHEPMRLSIVVYAPKDKLMSIIKNQPVLNKLFSNQWLHLNCFEPDFSSCFNLKEDLTWQSVH